MQMIYLDNNSTTQPDAPVIAAMVDCLQHNWANPSSVHRPGQHARAAVDSARRQVADLIGAQPQRITFTGGGSESINTAIVGLLAARFPRRKIISSGVEHSATRELLNRLGQRDVQYVQISVDSSGQLDLDQLARQLDEQTALASFIWANNETGVIFPMEQITRLCRQKNVPLHIDATQAVGKIPVDVRELEPAAMSFAAHKFHGPKGVGVLYLGRAVRCGPLVVGGPQESGHRGGTENVPGIVGAGVAAKLALEFLPGMPQVALLRDQLEQGILTSIPDTRVMGDTARRLPNTTNIGFAPLAAEAIVLLCSEAQICVSAGAACASGSIEPSHVLAAMEAPAAYAHGAVRFSLSRFTTARQINHTLEVLPEMIQRLRQITA